MSGDRFQQVSGRRSGPRQSSLLARFFLDGRAAGDGGGEDVLRGARLSNGAAIQLKPRRLVLRERRLADVPIDERTTDKFPPRSKQHDAIQRIQHILQIRHSSTDHGLREPLQNRKR